MQSAPEERKVLQMVACKSYKKCLCCGKTCSISDKREKCACGGHLYIAGQYYQKAVGKKK